MKYLLLLVSVFVFATVASAQSSGYYLPPPRIAPTPCMDGTEPIRILLKDSYKIKAMNSVSSETARVADYVEFKTMEPIYSVGPYPAILFEKDTPIYAVVTRRNHRHFPLVRGKLEIALEPLMTWDNRRIEMAIARYGLLKGTETGFRDQKDLDKRNKGINKPCKIDTTTDCVAGRGNAAVSVVVTAIAGASGAAVSAVAKDDDTKFIAATSFFSVAKDLGNLLNGTDVGIAKDEIFNLTLKKDSAAVCKVPKPKPEPPDPTKIMIVKPSQ
jgi:hypothetical protein